MANTWWEIKQKKHSSSSASLPPTSLSLPFKSFRTQKLSTFELEECLRLSFLHFDRKDTGKIFPSDLLEGMLRLGFRVSQRDANSIFEGIDIGGTGQLSLMREWSVFVFDAGVVSLLTDVQKRCEQGGRGAMGDETKSRTGRRRKEQPGHIEQGGKQSLEEEEKTKSEDKSQTRWRGVGLACSSTSIEAFTKVHVYRQICTFYQKTACFASISRPHVCVSLAVTFSVDIFLLCSLSLPVSFPLHPHTHIYICTSSPNCTTNVVMYVRLAPLHI